MLTVLDLFSGIGGFSLGLERTGGFQTVAFCEIDPYCRQVLAKHWPEVPCYDDIRTVTAARLAADGIGNVVADANGSRFGRAQPTDEEHGQILQSERPARNDTRTSCIDVICGGFPCQDISTAGKGAGIDGTRSGLWSEMVRVIGEVRPRYAIVENVAALLGRGLSRVLGDLAALGFDAEWHCIPAAAVGAPHRRDRIWIMANAECERLYARRFNQTGPFARCSWQQFSHWQIEPDVGRVAHGVPKRVDRLRALGNAVVPQIPELIGRAILTQEKTNAGS